MLEPIPKKVELRLREQQMQSCEPAAVLGLHAGAYSTRYVPHSFPCTSFSRLQIVWDESSKLGCSHAQCPVLLNPEGDLQEENVHFYICFYYPGCTKFTVTYSTLLAVYCNGKPSVGAMRGPLQTRSRDDRINRAKCAANAVQGRFGVARDSAQVISIKICKIIKILPTFCLFLDDCFPSDSTCGESMSNAYFAATQFTFFAECLHSNCKNCASYDANTCKCLCKRGWAGTDCSSERKVKATKCISLCQLIATKYT